MSEYRNKWWKMMIDKYGSEEAVRELMRESGAVGGAALVPKGLSRMHPEKRAQIQAQGRLSRRAKKETADMLRSIQ